MKTPIEGVELDNLPDYVAPVFTAADALSHYNGLSFLVREWIQNYVPESRDAEISGVFNDLFVIGSYLESIVNEEAN